MSKLVAKYLQVAARRSLLLACVVVFTGCSIAPLKQQLAPAGTALDRYPQVQRDATYLCEPEGVLGVSGSDCRIDRASQDRQSVDHDLHVRFQSARDRALKNSTTSTNASADAIAYFNTGKALIQTLCSRWFDSMELEERRLDGVDKSFNVWKAFGTTLLGLGNANSAIVGLYGGATTLESGLSTAYKDVYLLGGSISKVKLKIFGLLDQYAGHVKFEAMTYDDAYVALERMGTLCSPATAKLIIDAGVDAVHLTVNSSLLIEPTSSPITVALADINAIAQQRDALSRQETELASSKADTAKQLGQVDRELQAAKADLQQAEADAERRALIPEGDNPEAAAARTKDADRIEATLRAAKATVDKLESKRVLLQAKLAELNSTQEVNVKLRESTGKAFEQAIGKLGNKATTPP